MTILDKPHYNKPLHININGECFNRYPVKTKVITPQDDFDQIIIDELKDKVDNDDFILIAESALAAYQNRAIPIEEIKPGFWANTLTKYMTKTKAGIGASDPLTMQVVIQEVGLLKVLIGAFFAAITKPFGIKGVFYKITGDQARGVDGPADYVIPPYNKYVVRAPKNPGTWAQNLEEKFKNITNKNVNVVVIDANDLGTNALEAKSKQIEKIAITLAKDNPLGQSNESTPILWCKKINCEKN